MLRPQFFFSSNVSAGLSKSISKALGFTITNNLGWYLGMPLLHSRVTKNTYQDIVDKVEKRLSSWNASHLSLAFFGWAYNSHTISATSTSHFCHADDKSSGGCQVQSRPSMLTFFYGVAIIKRGMIKNNSGSHDPSPMIFQVMT